MKTHWKDLFHFNRRERNGILVLVTLIFFAISFQWMMPWLVSNELEVTEFEFENVKSVPEVEITFIENVEKGQGFIKTEEPKTNSENHFINADIFDPNKGSLSNWMSVGLNKGQVKSIQKYLDKGGRFNVKSDVKKMYVISDSQYEVIEPFLKVASSKKVVTPIMTQKVEIVLTDSSLVVPRVVAQLVELNTADTTELIALKGIGSYYASQIVKYREKLGGYYALEQLFEVNHMREETVLMILPYVKVDTFLLQKLHINKDKAIIMVVHPYITWEMANKIEEYRNFNKRYKSVNDLIKYGLLTEELYSKLAPYLTL